MRVERRKTRSLTFDSLPFMPMLICRLLAARRLTSFHAVGYCRLLRICSIDADVSSARCDIRLPLFFYDFVSHAAACRAS